MARLKVPFAIQSYSGRARIASLERLVNLLPEQNIKSNTTNEIYLVSMPGSRVSSIINEPVYKLHNANNRLYGIAKNGLWDFTVSGKPKHLFEYRSNNIDLTIADGYNIADSGVQTNWIWWSDNGRGYVHNVQEGTTNQITDDSFLPANSTTHLDSYAIWSRKDSNEFFWSNVADYENYDGLDFASAEGNADNIVRIIAFESELWILGEKTTEIWANTGDQNAPFQRLGNAFIEVGCANGQTVAKLTRDLYFVGDDLKVYRTAARSYQAQPISTHQGVEHDLNNFGVEGAYGFGVTIEGHDLYYLTIPKANRTWVYDEKTGLWIEASSLVDGKLKPNCCGWCNKNTGTSCENEAYGQHLSLCGTMLQGKAYIGASDGVYHLDHNYFKDGDNNIMREATMGPETFNSEKVIINRVELNFQNDCGFLDSSCDSSVGDIDSVTLQTSNDLGKTWKDLGSNWISKDNSPDYVPSFSGIGRSKTIALRWRTYYDRQLVFNGANLFIEGVNSGR